MGKSNPTPPAPVVVNAGASAAEQAALNQEAAAQQMALNTMNQYTPYGSLEYNRVGTVDGVPDYEAVQTLSPEQQALYDSSTRLKQQYGDIGETQLGRVQGRLSDPFSISSFGPAPVVNEETRRATLEAMRERANPQFDRERDALETRLANQGFARGSEAFDAETGQLGRTMNDFELAAQAQAGNEMARMYSLESNARDRAINEALMERNQPLSELASLMSGSQPTGPSFVNTPQGQIAAPDFMGAELANAQMQNQLNQSNYQSQMENRGGLGSILGPMAQFAGATSAWKWGG